MVAAEYCQVDREELNEILQEVKAAVSEKSYEVLRGVVSTLDLLTQLLERKETTCNELRKLIFGPKSEKTKGIKKRLKKKAKSRQQPDGPSTPQDDPTAPTSSDDPPPAAHPKGDQKQNRGDNGSGTTKRRKGHGRNGADAYTGADKVFVPNQLYNAGDDCSLCPTGTLHPLSKPAPFIHIVGQAPLKAIVYLLEQLRCGACGRVFTAVPPKETKASKYDTSAAAMIALLRYGFGLPHNRLDKLQAGFGVPVPSSTQWDVIKEYIPVLLPLFQALIRLGAQGEVLHNDDTTMVVLSLLEVINEEQNGRSQPKAKRTGIFTTNVLAKVGERIIALFFTGRNHAGENLASVLEQRSKQLDAPVQMCDGLDRNLPKELKTILANCISHARRRFVAVVDNFPDECLHVIELLKTVYQNDAVAREQNMSPDQRLRFHKAKSGPVMQELENWLDEQFTEKKVEPNSGLGQAISYMRNRWDKLTLFLRVPGAPLDNNISERALKMAITHRKNSLFYKTENGALAGDIFMSLIHTANLAGAEPFDYLVAIMSHPKYVEDCPDKWLPWNYRDTLNAMASTDIGASQAPPT